MGSVVGPLNLQIDFNINLNNVKRLLNLEAILFPILIES